MRTDLDAARPITLDTAFTGTSRMNNWTRLFSILTLSLSIPSAYAHDPKEHAREAAEAKAGPNCAALHDMDHSKMDPNDPVMKAMMARCAAAGHSRMDMDHEALAQPTPGAAATPHDHGSH